MESKSSKIRYNGANFRPWKIAFEAALRAAGLEETLTDVNNGNSNNQAVNILIGMLAEEKIVLLEGIRTIPAALNAIKDDRARESPAVRYTIQQEYVNHKFRGNMKEYLDKLENIVNRYKQAGAQCEDREVLSKVTSDVGKEYVVVTFAFTNTTTFAEAKIKLLEAHEVLSNMPDDSLKEMQVLLAAKKEENKKDQEIKELRTQLEALKVEVMKREHQRGQPSRPLGKCFNCEQPGHYVADCRRHLNKPDCKCKVCRIKSVSHYQSSPIIANVNLNDFSGKCVLDSGATDHFCDGSVALEDFKPLSHIRVSMANGVHSYVKGSGAYFNKELKLKLTDVKAVNALKQGLISVAKLTDSGYSVTFDRTGANIVSAGKVLSRVPRVGNLYAISSAAEVPEEPVQSMMAVTSSEIWHKRLGHTGVEKMKQLSDSIPGVSAMTEHCDACKRGKLKQGPFRRSDSRATRPLELVHMDLAGPHPVPGSDGSRYFVVFVDDYSRHIAVFLLKDRTQAILAFKLYRQQMESQCKGNHKVSQLLSDQARELTSGEFTEYLINNQINHRLSTPHSHQQNGIAERAIQSIRNIARTNLISGNAPERFWPEAVKIAAYQYNIVPHSTDSKTTPYERMFGKKPDYDRLRPFGALTYFYKHPVQRESSSKWTATGTAGAFLGYQEDMKAYRIWDPSSRTAVKTCNAEVIEGESYWKRQQQQSYVEQIRPVERVDAVEYSPFSIETADEEVHPNEPLGVMTESSSQQQSTSPVMQSPRRVVSPQVQSLSPELSSPLPVPSTPVSTQRYPTRDRRAPVRLQLNPQQKSYVVDETNLIICSAECNNSKFEEEFADELFIGVAVSGVKVPQTYNEAMASPERERWLEAIAEESRSLLEKGVYEEVTGEQSRLKRKPLTTRWVFSLKVNSADNTIKRFKARVVIRGFEQLEGLDFEKIFAPTVSHATVRTFLAHAAASGMEVHHVDVKTAFLNSEVDRELYCKPPDGLQNGPTVWRLLKSLYGLRQAPHCWHKKLCQILVDDGFEQGKVDQCVFVRKTSEGETLVLVYVDDVLVASSSLALTERFKEVFKSKVEIRDLGRIKQFIGLQVNYNASERCYTVSQEKLISDYFQEFGLSTHKPVRRLPEVEHMRPGIETLSPAEQTKYRQLVGGLLYIANLTRLDVCFVVNYLSRFMQTATQVHLQNAEKVLVYLHYTRQRRLHLGKLDDQLLTCYSDASFRKDEKDQTGVVVTYKGSIVHWISRKQDNYNQSTTEAEYCALQLAADECLWLRQLLMDWGVEIKAPTRIFEDNKQVIKLVTNGQVHTRAKYLAVKLRALHDLITRGHITVEFVPSRDQWADMLTKSQLPQDVERMFSSKSMNAVRNRGACERLDSSQYQY